MHTYKHGSREKTRKLTAINNLFWFECTNGEGGRAVQGESLGWLAPFPKLLIDSLRDLAISHFTVNAWLLQCGWGFLSCKLIGNKLLDNATAFIY